MENDLAEIKERQDLLEAHVDALEARIDWQEGMLKLVDAGIRATARPNAAKAQAGAVDVGDVRRGAQDVESLLRAVVLTQSRHSSIFRSLEKTQQSGQSRLQSGVEAAVTRLDSILESLRRVDRDLRALKELTTGS